jgi:hypothetical protein
MTEEELKKAIRLLITWYDGEGDLVDGIVMLLREAGWKSPDRIPNATICPKCNEMHWIK